ncbi:MAG: hydroxymethylglutaryl-CoA reductase, degradative [Gammaproteobacteria bacterium]
MLDFTAFFNGFSKLKRAERLQRLIAMGILTTSDVQHLQQATSNELTTLTEHFIENAIGCFQLPLGVATNFHIDGRDYVIPMAVEETSIVAAASSTAKWLRRQGEITTCAIGTDIIGQLQIAKVNDLSQLNKVLAQYKTTFIQLANQHVVPNLVVRGGGVTDIQLRPITRDDGSMMAVIHVLLNPGDAMGANLVNQVCEYLKPHIEARSGERVTMCILSNLVDTKLTRAMVRIRNIDPQVGENIVEAALFAEQDPYRAATHNKGVLNGIDAVLVATGNDWRAVEAGVHAYAARSGQYRAITSWRMHGLDLIGTLEAPIVVGTVGGVTCLHPTAQLCLRMLGVERAEHLARIAAAVGLVQNLGALRALTTKGIVQGHMKLHINNLLLAAGAAPTEQETLRQQLLSLLQIQRKITLSDVKALLSQLREEYAPV